MNFVHSSFKTSFFALLGGLFLLSACGDDASDQHADAPNPTVAVAVGKAEAKPFTRIETFPSTIKSPNEAQISTRIMSKIERIHAEVGDFVRRGATLITIDDDDLMAQKQQVQATMAEAQANLKNVETNFARFTKLYEQGSATKKELDDVTTQREVTTARIAALNAKMSELDEMLTYTKITAPFNGFVVSKNASVGDLTAPGHPILMFEEDGAKEISITIPESKLALFQMGDTLQVSLPAQSTMLQAKITNISVAGNRASRQFEAVLKVMDTANSTLIKSGMFVEVNVNAPSAAAILVPNTALINRGQLTGLYTLTNNNQLILRWVRIGRIFGSHTEILSGLMEDEAFVLSPTATLVEGQQVTIK